MSDELLHLVNIDDSLLIWSADTVYWSRAKTTPQVLNEVGVPVYCKQCKGLPTERLLAYGDFTGSVATVYLVKIISSTTFSYSINLGVSWSEPQTITRNGHSLQSGIFVQFYATTGFEIGAIWGFTVYPCKFQSTSNYMRWSVVRWHDYHFFANQANPIKVINGKTVNNFFTNCIAPPYAKYIEIFHEHLVVANLIQAGNKYYSRMAWSDIHDFSVFEPKQTNESDFYDLTFTESIKEQFFGITGLKKLGPFLIAYGPKEVYRFSYAGLPTVMSKDETYTELGNAFPYALVGNNKMHAFISDENIYVFDVHDTLPYTQNIMPKPIGNPVKDWFFSNLSTDPEYRYRTYGGINRQFTEFFWVFVSKDSQNGAFDLIMAWNFIENTWFTGTVENYHSFVEATLREADTPIDSDTRTIDSATELIDRSGLNNTMSRVTLYGTSDRKLLREAIPADLDVDLLPQPVPYLETKDFYYDNLDAVKEIDTLYLSASYNAGGCSGVEVYYSVRNGFDDPVVWVKSKEVWTPNLSATRLSGVRVAGKIFRFKFVWKEKTAGQGVRDAVFSAWGEHVYGVPDEPQKLAEK